VADASISDEQNRIDRLKQEIGRRQLKDQIMLAIAPSFFEKGAETFGAILGEAVKTMGHVSLEERAKFFKSPELQELKQTQLRGTARELWAFVEEIMEMRDLTPAQRDARAE